MPPKIISPLGRRPHFIKEWRKHRGLTQPELAERLGTSKQSVSRIESGEQPYTQDSLEAIAHVLQCEPIDLIARDPDQEPDLPIFDLPGGDQGRVRDFIRALRVTRTNEPAEEEQPVPVKRPAARTRRKPSS